MAGTISNCGHRRVRRILPRSVKALVNALSRVASTDRLHNPYRSKLPRDNLRQYLLALQLDYRPRLLLVGEALGYRGGRLTGIPFSSERLLRQHPHGLWRLLENRLAIRGDSSEATASMIWNYLHSREMTPLCWNACPFHPHHSDDHSSNRSPSASELREGQVFLESLAVIYNPDLIVGVGSKGYQAACQAFPERDIVRVRHPSYGGKEDFVRGMDAIRAQLDCGGSR